MAHRSEKAENIKKQLSLLPKGNVTYIGFVLLIVVKGPLAVVT